MVASLFGLLGIDGFIGFALWPCSIWFGAIAVFMTMDCWGGLGHAEELQRLAKLPSRETVVFPSCRTEPRWAPTGNAGVAGSSSTPSKPELSAQTALSSLGSQGAWTVEHSIP